MNANLLSLSRVLLSKCFRRTNSLPKLWPQYSSGSPVFRYISRVQYAPFQNLFLTCCSPSLLQDQFRQGVLLPICLKVTPQCLVGATRIVRNQSNNYRNNHSTFEGTVMFFLLNIVFLDLLSQVRVIVTMADTACRDQKSIWRVGVICLDPRHMSVTSHLTYFASCSHKTNPS